MWETTNNSGNSDASLLLLVRRPDCLWHSMQPLPDEQRAPRHVSRVGAKFEGDAHLRCFGLTLKLTYFFRRQNQKPLSHLIENMLASEDLSGDNKYRCDHCASLQNATRYTRLETLPPASLLHSTANTSVLTHIVQVLHFSLLRFGFDYSTMTRKKSQAFVKFPKSIDMGDYLGDLESEDYLTREERWFDLKGILLHRGTSAHSGHYTAQIYDEE